MIGKEDFVLVAPPLSGVAYTRQLRSIPGQPGTFGTTVTDLIWHRHLGVMDGADTWQPSHPVNTGWDFDVLLPGAYGTLYGARSDGVLWWYEHRGAATGTMEFVGPHLVGNGFVVQHFRDDTDTFVGFLCDREPTTTLLAAGAVLYGLRTDGDLWWYRHEGAADGTPVWARGGVGGIRVGNGWRDGTLSAFSGHNGVIYRVTDDGVLHWYRHDGNLDGTNVWAPRREIGNGWDQFAAIMSPGQGVIYGIRPDGTTMWYRHLGYADGSARWANDGVGKPVHPFSEVPNQLVRSEIRPHDIAAPLH